ncbi:hypothetical protein F5B22DRAFT_644632 [Xylaria bambusicola]|uniref:uncharacterized protein n=1 Tax=Xylaria bambusicola TaxID=326684 RepID=UPI00200884A8|nr:uncharacterized protein F5B22DRAFT_644632 [Xylaria bambusicola]KAI0520891.1 hypothetical protein F5B22DRAFT_644632 [Xylaria bambusicola]
MRQTLLTTRYENQRPDSHPGTIFPLKTVAASLTMGIYYFADDYVKNEVYPAEILNWLYWQATRPKRPRLQPGGTYFYVLYKEVRVGNMKRENHTLTLPAELSTEYTETNRANNLNHANECVLIRTEHIWRLLAHAKVVFCYKYTFLSHGGISIRTNFGRSVNPQYPIARWPWEDVEDPRDRYIFCSSPSDYQFTPNPSPFHSTSFFGRTPMASFYPGSFSNPSDGLPVLSTCPTSMAKSYELLPETDPPAAPGYTSFRTDDCAMLARNLDRDHKRQYQLEDEIYPLKLIRALKRGSDDLPPSWSENSVFGVVHINSLTGSHPTVEIISTYSTIQAANNRVLDFWDQKYGARMFTNATSSPRANATAVMLDDVEKTARCPQSTSDRKMKQNFSGGVPANKSYWAIKNKCLSLKHRSGAGEVRVYVTISHMRDQGIHV